MGVSKKGGAVAAPSLEQVHLELESRRIDRRTRSPGAQRRRSAGNRLRDKVSQLGKLAGGRLANGDILIKSTFILESLEIMIKINIIIGDTDKDNSEAFQIFGTTNVEDRLLETIRKGNVSAVIFTIGGDNNDTIDKIIHTSQLLAVSAGCNNRLVSGIQKGGHSTNLENTIVIIFVDRSEKLETMQLGENRRELNDPKEKIILTRGLLTRLENSFDTLFKLCGKGIHRRTGVNHKGNQRVFRSPKGGNLGRREFVSRASIQRGEVFTK